MGLISTTVITTAGTGTVMPPAGAKHARVECWGAGGGGSRGQSAGWGGQGGGGGAYSLRVLDVTAGTPINYSIGAGGAGGTSSNGLAGGDTWFVSSSFGNSQITAVGGAGALQVDSSGQHQTSASGGLWGNCSGVLRAKGGDGASAQGGGNGGAGGQSGGSYNNGITAVPGQNSTTTTARTLTSPLVNGSDAGLGGNGSTSGAGSAGTQPGGGGGGGFYSAGNGGAGATGQIRISWYDTYPSTILTPVEDMSSTVSTSVTAPAGATNAIVECWGAGGGGCAPSNNIGMGGGGGGAYAAKTITVVGGNSYTYQIGGAGAASNSWTTPGGTGADTWFINATTVMAKGGGGGSNSVAGAGGSAALSVGDVKAGGGNGSKGTSSTSGAGGSSAGSADGLTAISGNSASGHFGGTAPVSPDGINSGRGGQAVEVTGQTLSPYIGGGGQSDRNSNQGAAGGEGQIRVTWIIPTDGGVTYLQTLLLSI